MASEQIRSRCLPELGDLWRTVRKLEGLYPDFPDAPAHAWRVSDPLRCPKHQRFARRRTDEDGRLTHGFAQPGSTTDGGNLQEAEAALRLDTVERRTGAHRNVSVYQAAQDARRRPEVGDRSSHSSPPS